MLMAVAIGAAARTFEVGFLVDPLGPKALPFLVTGLFLVGGLALLLFPAGGGAPGEDGVWARRGSRPGSLRDPRRLPATPGKAGRSQVYCILVLLGYASALPFLGFVVSTSLATGALSRVFAGRFLPGLGVGLAIGLGLFGLFTLGFGMELPVGLLLGGEL